MIILLPHHSPSAITSNQLTVGLKRKFIAKKKKKKKETLTKLLEKFNWATIIDKKKSFTQFSGLENTRFLIFEQN